MATVVSSIEPLPVEAQLRLRSGVVLNSLNDAIIGLIKNSLDAGAQTIHVEADFSRGNCCVEDDGAGIPAAEFEAHGGLGLMHHTSKFTLASRTHGQYGQFLASLSALSFLSISSRRASERTESNIAYHHSEVLIRRRNVSEKEQRVGGRSGTRVVVRDLFGNLAVRVKQRALQFGSVERVERELDHLKFQVVAIALAWPKAVRIVVSNQQAQQRKKFIIGKQAKAAGRGRCESPRSQRTSAFRLDRVRAILSHAGYIAPTDSDFWTSVSAQTSQLFVRAAICQKPAPSKIVQVISLGIHPLDSSSNLSQALCREINNLFAESAFGTFQELVDISEEERPCGLRDRRFNNDDCKDRQLKRRGKGADRWPMFYIRIEARDSDVPAGVLKREGGDAHAAKFLEMTVQLIRSMLHHFLKEQQVLTETRTQRNGRQPAIKGFAPNEPAPHRPAGSPCPPQLAEVSHLMLENCDGELCCSPMNLDSDTGRRKTQRLHSGFSFNSWSRIKTAKLHALDDLESGLPRSKLAQVPNCGISGTVLNVVHPASHAANGVMQMCSLGQHSNEDEHLLLQNLSEDSDIETGGHREAFGQKAKVLSEAGVAEAFEWTTTSEPQYSADGVIVWRNPISGNSMRINSRTGLSMPQLSPGTLNEPQASTATVSGRLSSNVRASLREAPHSARLNAKSPSESCSWLATLMGSWQNPVFRLQERPIPSVVLDSAGKLTATSFQSYHGKHNYFAESQVAEQDCRLSKAALAGADIHGQVDKKFILVTMKVSRTEMIPGPFQQHHGTVLVLIDQHAADERCRVESLLGDMTAVKRINLSKPIVFEVTAQEMELFQRQQSHFETWGIVYQRGTNPIVGEKDARPTRPSSADVRSARPLVDIEHKKRSATAVPPTSHRASPRRHQAMNAGLQIAVHALPEVIAERCRLDPKLLMDLLRTEVWVGSENVRRAAVFRPPASNAHTDDGDSAPTYAWLKYFSSCPRGIIDLVNSRACRSAIMFNDSLTKAECGELVKKLAQCAFPFQCAHGRPSMVVLGGLDSAVRVTLTEESLRTQSTGNSMPQENDRSETFLQAFQTWRPRE